MKHAFKWVEGGNGDGGVLVRSDVEKGTGEVRGDTKRGKMKREER